MKTIDRAVRIVFGLALCAALAACGRSQSSGSNKLKDAPAGVANAAPLAAATPDAGGGLNFETSCALDGTTVKGYVSNKSSEIYQVIGSVRFSFPNPGNAAIGELRATANAVVPPNQTVLAASSSVPFVIAKQSACRFDVDDALRKQGR